MNNKKGQKKVKPSEKKKWISPVFSIIRLGMEVTFYADIKKS